MNFICRRAASGAKHIVLHFPCFSNWSSCFSPALCCQQNVTRLQSVSWSEVITCRRNSEGKNLTREAWCRLAVGCCPESVSDLSNWFKLNWHGAPPDITMLLYISEPFWAVNAFRVKKECAKETQRSQPQGQWGLQKGPLRQALRTRRLYYYWSSNLVFSQHFLAPCHCDRSVPRPSPWGLGTIFLSASGSVYLFIVTLLSSVPGSFGVRQQQLLPEGRQGNSNPSLFLMGLVTLAKSFNLNTLGLSFITEQGSEWALDHLDRVSGGITN